MKQPRHLHLVGAIGEIRNAQYDGRDHLVVPVVAMVEGVVWASNAETPEFVPAEELAETPQQWNGRGCFAGHPKNGNLQVTANTPRTLETSFGVVFDASSSERILKTRRLEMQAWLDPTKAEAVGLEAVDVIRRLRAGKRVEVSVGCYVEAEQKDGTYDGKEYHSVWRSIVSDHLAFLEEGATGACSIEAGCGAPRMAVKHFVTAEGIRREGKDREGMMKISVTPEIETRHAIALARLRKAEAEASVSDAELRGKLHDALFAIEPGFMGVSAVYPADNYVVYEVCPEDTWKTMRRSYTIKDGAVTLNKKAEEVEFTGSYKPVTAAARKPAVIVPPVKTASCRCEGDNMEPKTKAELIAALVTDKHSGFKDGDEAVLEATSDARLEEFRSAADANKATANSITKLETENRNISARLKVAEDRLKAAESTLTDEEFIQRASDPIKAILNARKAEEESLRASFVSQLKDLGANTEDELKKKSISELQTLAAYARIEVPDFSGRGLPKERFTTNNMEDYTPPDPYAKGLEALRAKM